MSYKVKPQLKLYKYENSTFVMQAQIDDYSEVSFEHNLYQAGTFTISINYNIPNSQLFQRGLFVQFGNNPGDFGEIYSIQDSISKDGKGSQTRTIVGYDARYILKRRVIKNMNSNGLWVMTAKGELCIRNLIKDQCGVDAEEKRRLPIINNIPDVSGAKGKEYSVSEQFTNLYEVCKTIATQSEIGWRISFINNELNLEIYEGEDLSQTVRFDTNYESLANGKFSDTSESFSNAIYIGGKGQNDSRDIYEGENGSPSGFNRFESWDNQSQMTTEDEYETEAISMLSQYGQTLTITGNGLVKCPYVFREQYNVGDIITVAFSGKSAAAQILSVTEHWSFGNYEINFNFGKPQNNLSDQLQLMLRQIQKASETSNSTESVKWYNVANENTMDSADVTYNTIGFTGAMTSNKTFTFYLDDEKTGAKSYNIYAKNLTGNYNLTLTTGRSGKTNVVLKGGVNITARILVDDEGNIISQGMTSTSIVESGNNQPVTSDGVAETVGNIEYGKFNRLPSGANLNDCVDSKVIYYNSSTEEINSFINRPTFLPGGEMALFFIPLGNSNYTTQIYIGKSRHRSFIAQRLCTEGTWTDWQRIDAGLLLDNFTLSYSYMSGYSGSNIEISHLNVICGSLLVIHLMIHNISGGSIGSITTNVIATTNLRPKQETNAIGMDYVSGRPVRVAIGTDGTLKINESLGITQGNNVICTTLILPI